MLSVKLSNKQAKKVSKELGFVTAMGILIQLRYVFWEMEAGKSF